MRQFTYDQYFYCSCDDSCCVYLPLLQQYYYYVWPHHTAITATCMHQYLSICNSKHHTHVLSQYTCYINEVHQNRPLLRTYRILYLTNNRTLTRIILVSYLYAYSKLNLTVTPYTAFHQSRSVYKKLYGGGLRPTHRALTGDPIPLKHYQQKGKMSIAVNITQQNQWCPRHQFPIRHDDHPIEQLLTESDFQTIQAFARQSQHRKLTYITNSHLTAITTESLQELISHGEMIIDNVLNVFLEIMCTATDINYLSTFFISLLRQDGIGQD
jgi:hypothetical protein